MTTIANLLGSVMTAVRLPRNKNYTTLETYVKTEFQKGDQAYVMDCMLHGHKLDYRNII